MELLPQVTVKKEQKDAREAEVFRKLRVAKQVEKEQKAINAVIQDFEPEKLKIKKEFEEFRSNAERKKSELLGEILVLEKRRDTVMEPFYKIKFDANEMIEVAQGYERKVKAEAKRVNILHDAVIAKNNELSEREGALVKKESQIGKREIAVVENENRIAIAHSNLNEVKESFEVERKRVTEELEAKDSDLKKREAEVEAKVLIIEKQKEDLRVERIQIDDQRKTLDRGFNELRSKQ